MRQHRVKSALALLALVALLLPASQATAEEEPRRTTPAEQFQHVGPSITQGKLLPYDPSALLKAKPRASSGQTKVGDKKWWLAIDDTVLELGGIYPKQYRLRARSKHMEVWTAAGTDDASKGLFFPEGDCRNDNPERVKITKAQIKYFLNEFETNMYPKESEAFSTPPKRNGTRPFKFFRNLFFSKKVRQRLGMDADYWKGKGGRIVTLVDNVRDENFYDTDNQNTLVRIGGFFYSVFNETFDRNVMTIDSWDWLHSTTENPPNEPTDDPCTSATGNPFSYEQTFAHEYQHLLEYYEDPDETNWINEGLAEWATTLTGYSFPSAPITDVRWDSDIQCLLGYIEQQTDVNPFPSQGGPENSLTLWGDQGGDGIENDEILCDYGAASTMMEFLNARYGPEFMRRMHVNNKNGLKQLDSLVEQFHPGGIEGQQVIHEWAAMLTLDRVLDEGATFTGGDPTSFITPTLDALIDWTNDDAYSTPGAPPNGGDFVQLRGNGGNPLRANQINNITFNGSSELDSLPIEWEVDPAPPLGHDGDPALYSGSGASFDRAIIEQVDVPAEDPTLRFETLYETEELFDYAIVQVSTDNGETWTSLANENTTTEHDPTAEQRIVAELPGLDGNSGGGAQPEWVTETFDLSDYAGQAVHLSFRYMTDTGFDLAGWWIDDVQVGATTLTDGSTLEGWQSLTQVNPVDVNNFYVQVVAYDDAHTGAHLGRVFLDENFDGTLEGQVLADIIGNQAETVGVIVTYDEPTENITQYAPYALTVNGVLQPGGS